MNVSGTEGAVVLIGSGVCSNVEHLSTLKLTCTLPEGNYFAFKTPLNTPLKYLPQNLY